MISIIMPTSGLRTWLPADVKKQIYVTDKLIELYSNWGYEPITIPTLIGMSVLEQANIKFKSKTFKFVDKDGELLALRPELTQPIAKAIANRAEELTFPLRLYYSSTVFRFSGLNSTDDSREIQQAGIELIGSAENQLFSDFEVTSLMIESLEQFKLKNWIISITHAKLWQKIFANYTNNNSAKDLNVDQSLAQNVYNALLKGDIIAFKNLVPDKHPLRSLLGNGDLKHVEQVEKAFDFELAHLKEIMQLHPNVMFDPLQCPDIKLYTGIHFNLMIKGQGNLVAMGGRYDNLYKSFGADLPAIGFAYYLPRFFAAIESQGLMPRNIGEDGYVKVKPKGTWDETLEEVNKSIKSRRKVKIVAD